MFDWNLNSQLLLHQPMHLNLHNSIVFLMMETNSSHLYWRIWISRIQHATEDYPNASRNFSGPWWSPWTYEQYPPTQNSVINEPWDIQPNTPYRITLIATTNNVNSATPVTWNYNVVNVGDFVSMNVNAKIHNNHCKVNTNTTFRKNKNICRNIKKNRNGILNGI